MYIFGIAIVVAFAVLAALFSSSSIVGGAGTAGAVGKQLYFNKAFSRLLKANELKLVGSEREEYLRRAGGVSWLAGGLMAAILIVSTILAIQQKIAR